MNVHQGTTFGGKRDAHDPRDFVFAPKVKTLPSSVDLRPCVQVYDQLPPIQSCSANALAAMFEFVARKHNETFAPPSRLFIYYNERKAEGTQGSDCGATIRSGMKSIAKQGICAESSWPYLAANVTVEPPPACYAEAKSTRAISYSRLHKPIEDGKACLAEGYPFVVGIEVYWNSILAAQHSGHVALPAPDDKVMGGHAVMIVGYDGSTQTFLALNSLGTAWGDGGYFTLPYAYLTNPKLAYDFWTLRRVI